LEEEFINPNSEKEYILRKFFPVLDDNNPGNRGLYDGFRKTFFRIFQLLFALLSLSFCASPHILMPEHSAQQPANDRIPNPSFCNYEHHIEIDDKLSTSIRGHGDLSIGSLFGIYNSNEVYGKWVLAGKDGYAVFPAIGPVFIAGLTTKAAADTLALRDAVQIKNPVVVVKVLNMQVSVSKVSTG
jgi:polysaccharide export outer membrane protein